MEVEQWSIDYAPSVHGTLQKRAAQADYTIAEKSFGELLNTDCLDTHVQSRPRSLRLFEEGMEQALVASYEVTTGRDSATDGSAHRFLQRVLYRINRLKLFWFDDLLNYQNEDSCYLHRIRRRIEETWQAWELTLAEIEPLHRDHACEALLRRAACDLAPATSARGLYFRNTMTEVGYRCLLAIAALDGMVEASQLSRTLGGVSNEIHSMMTRLLVEEYGGGRINRKHSTFFKAMLTELGMRTEPEAYFDLVPWEVLAGINHSFLLSERKRLYLRYVGGLLYTEISVPAAFDNYRAAAERLLMSKTARGYWELHINEDKRHGHWMLHDVALPLAAKYPADAWEIILGYDQQKFISDRAATSVLRSVEAAEREPARWDTTAQNRT